MDDDPKQNNELLTNFNQFLLILIKIHLFQIKKGIAFTCDMKSWTYHTVQQF
jgi:hypothetical protein